MAWKKWSFPIRVFYGSVKLKTRQLLANSDVTKPKAYAEEDEWSDTITVTEQGKKAKWERLDPLAEGESYVIIEYAVAGVDEADIARDQASGAIKSFMLNGKLYVVSNEDTSTDGNLTVNTEYENTNIVVQKVWAGNADAGTSVMVTFVPDKPGVESQIVPLGSDSWSASTVLPRLDDNGDLISWSVNPTATSPANNAIVSLLDPSNGRLSDDGDTVNLVGSVVGGMTVRFRMARRYLSRRAEQQSMAIH